MSAGPSASAMAEVPAVSVWSTWGVPLIVGRPVGSELAVVSSVSEGASPSWIVPVATASPKAAHLGCDRVRVRVSVSSVNESLVTGTLMVSGRFQRKVSVPLVAV